MISFFNLWDVNDKFKNTRELLQYGENIRDYNTIILKNDN